MNSTVKRILVTLLIFIPGAVLWGMGTESMSAGTGWVGIAAWAFNTFFLMGFLWEEL